MDEYIERDAANEALRECVRVYPNSFYNGIEVARTAIHKLPAAADVVQVVRCKDCKYWAYEKDLDTSVCVMHSISGWRRIMPETAYCSMGVRKEGQ